ncbi:hypothetical protein [Aquimarina sp. I32.4]|uniref:hypothetical protein n=1 Tax=Aquimarina sp. I32.4 TaxID=2053903 RepID=UPI000CDE6ABA|nr:hypothetical protein [Aquimarina sp. I32.4]
MKHILYSLVITVFSIVIVSCSHDDDEVAKKTFEFNFSFEKSKEGWESIFSDYPLEGDTFYELKYERKKLPEPLDQNMDAIMISGNNHSDDLFSAVYRKFENLEPNTEYEVTFDIEIASNTSINAIGIGGSPDIALGVGGINYKPENIIDNQDSLVSYKRPNFKSELQSSKSNEVFKVIGSVGVSEKIPTPFMLANRNNLKDPITLTTNGKGELWLMIATDSGFEGPTTLYYKSIKIQLK